MCNYMDQLGRMRELAKRKLAEIDSSTGLSKEREMRRKLNAKNRQLERELQQLKAESFLFGGPEE